MTGDHSEALSDEMLHAYTIKTAMEESKRWQFGSCSRTHNP